MDWQPATADFTSMHTEPFQTHCLQQWSLNEILSQSPSHNHPDTANPTAWPIGSVPITNSSQPHQELPFAPSSSLHAPSPFTLTHKTDSHMATPSFGQPGGMSPSPENATNPPRTQVSNHTKVTPSVMVGTSLPTRHASSATWKPASAKHKGPQSRIPLEARQILEDEFATNPYPCSEAIDIIAHQANLDVKKVRNWFNNTRARKKGEGMFPSSSPCVICSLGQTLTLPLVEGPTRVHLRSSLSSQETAWRLLTIKQMNLSNHLSHPWLSILHNPIKVKVPSLLTYRLPWIVTPSAVTASLIGELGRHQEGDLLSNRLCRLKAPRRQTTLCPRMAAAVTSLLSVASDDAVADAWHGKSLLTFARSMASIVPVNRNKTCPSSAPSVHELSRQNTNGSDMKTRYMPSEQLGYVAT